MPRKASFNALLHAAGLLMLACWVASASRIPRQPIMPPSGRAVAFPPRHAGEAEPESTTDGGPASIHSASSSEPDSPGRAPSALASPGTASISTSVLAEHSAGDRSVYALSSLRSSRSSRSHSRSHSSDDLGDPSHFIHLVPTGRDTWHIESPPSGVGREGNRRRVQGRRSSASFTFPVPFANGPVGDAWRADAHFHNGHWPANGLRHSGDVEPSSASALGHTSRLEVGSRSRSVSPSRSHGSFRSSSSSRLSGNAGADAELEHTDSSPPWFGAPSRFHSSASGGPRGLKIGDVAGASFSSQSSVGTSQRMVTAHGSPAAPHSPAGPLSLQDPSLADGVTGALGRLSPPRVPSGMHRGDRRGASLGQASLATTGSEMLSPPSQVAHGWPAAASSGGGRAPSICLGHVRHALAGCLPARRRPNAASGGGSGGGMGA